MTLGEFEQRFRKAQQDVLEAIRTIHHANLMNPHRQEKRVSYKEIRAWIVCHKQYHIENVGARCRALAHDVNPPKIVIEYDGDGVAWVSPLTEGLP